MADNGSCLSPGVFVESKAIQSRHISRQKLLSPRLRAIAGRLVVSLIYVKTRWFRLLCYVWPHLGY